MKSAMRRLAFPHTSAFLGIVLGVSFSISSAVVWAQTSTIPFFLEQLNQLSDNAAGYLVNTPGSPPGDVTIDVGDRLVGHFRIETLEDLTGGGGVYDILNSPVELTAVFDLTLQSKVQAGTSPFGPTFTMVFVPTPNPGFPGPAVPVGTMVRFYEDPSKDFTRLMSGGIDDGDPTLVGADIGVGPFATEMAIASTASGGTPFWDLGFTGAPGEGWVAVSIDNVLVARGISPPGNGGTINIAVNIIQNYIGPTVDKIDCTFGDQVDVCGSSNVLGVEGSQTPYDFFNNVDFAILPTEEVRLGCRVTGGGVATDTTPSGDEILVWDGTLTETQESMDMNGNGANTFQIGGQAGANTALPPQPKGEWNHHQQRGPAGSFSYHCGTSSAVAGTEIVEIRCSDPGGCAPSGNPPSPNKQLDFDCIGHFENIGHGNKEPDFIANGANVVLGPKGNRVFDGTVHWTEVNIDDNGEGPGPGEPDSAECPADGFGEKGSVALANCDCPDFYRITIYDGVLIDNVTYLPDGSIDPNSLNTTDVIYEVEAYLKSGNGLQLHDLTGFDRN